MKKFQNTITYYICETMDGSQIMASIFFNAKRKGDEFVVELLITIFSCIVVILKEVFKNEED